MKSVLERKVRDIFTSRVNSDRVLASFVKTRLWGGSAAEVAEKYESMTVGDAFEQLIVLAGQGEMGGISVPFIVWMGLGDKFVEVETDSWTLRGFRKIDSWNEGDYGRVVGALSALQSSNLADIRADAERLTNLLGGQS